MKIEGRTVLITGASSGIGLATAKAMAERGGYTILLARNKHALDEAVSGINSQGGRAVSYPVDLSMSKAVDQVAEMIQREVGFVDIVVNNAGAGRWLFVEETNPDEAVQMMAVPYLAAFYITRVFLPAMLERDEGHIVNITSLAAYAPWAGATGYTAARWAMRGFSEALRADLYGTNIKVTLFAPGEVNSPYWENNPRSRERIPKIGMVYPKMTPEQVAKAIVKAVENNKREVIVPLPLRLTVNLHRVFPFLTEWLVNQTGWRRK